MNMLSDEMTMLTIAGAICFTVTMLALLMRKRDSILHGAACGERR